MPARFIISAARPEQFPPEDDAEVAFLGRSNVGKSSLINALLGVDGLARTSARPGCTQVVNFYQVDIGGQQGQFLPIGTLPRPEPAQWVAANHQLREIMIARVGDQSLRHVRIANGGRGGAQLLREIEDTQYMLAPKRGQALQARRFYIDGMPTRV